MRKSLISILIISKCYLRAVAGIMGRWWAVIVPIAYLFPRRLIEHLPGDQLLSSDLSSLLCRTATQGLPALGATFNKYAYQPSSFKPPARAPSYSHPSVPITGAVRAQENMPALLKLP